MTVQDASQAPPPLRTPVLAGRFFGDAPAAADVGVFLTARRKLDALVLWFGRGRLAEIARGPDAADALAETIDRDIARIDAMISRQLDAILHHPRMARFEGTWRGLHWLVENVEHDRLVKVRVLSARWTEIARDLDRAIDFDRSGLFRLVYEEEFGTPGGEPFSMIAADYDIRGVPSPGHTTDDIATLGLLAGVAAAAFCPICLPAAPQLVGLDSFHGAGPAFDLAGALKRPEIARWRNLAAREDARFLAMLLPRTLARASWLPDGTRADRFRYREHAGAVSRKVWSSPVFAMAAVAARSFARYRWPGDIRGAEPSWDAFGGVVEALPHERFRADPPGPPPRPPLEVSLTDDQERHAAENEMIALCGLQGLPEASFGAVPTIHRPPRMTTDLANANQRLSAQLNSLLCVSRFAHVLKLMGRDMVGTFADAGEIELRLQRWLSQHIGGALGGSDSAARYPLRDARVEVREKPGKPGHFGCTILLQPHHQLDDVGASFRLVTEMKAPRAAA